MLLFVDGALMMLFVAAGMFFLRYWRSSRDRLYAMFALAFFILGVNRALLALFSHAPDMQEHNVVLYSIRLAAFLIILFAIVDKNRASRPHVTEQ